MHDVNDHLDAILALGQGETYTYEGYTWKLDEDDMLELTDSNGEVVTCFLPEDIFVEMNWPFEG